MWLAPIGWIRTKLLERKERAMIDEFTRGYDWVKARLDDSVDKEGEIKSLYPFLEAAETFGGVNHFDRGVEAAIGEFTGKATIGEALVKVKVTTGIRDALSKQGDIKERCKHHWVLEYIGYYPVGRETPPVIRPTYYFNCTKCHILEAFYKERHD